MRLLLILPLFLLSLLAVIRAPHGVLWIPAVAAIEWGYVLAVPTLLLAIAPVWDRTGQVATVLALVAILLFLSPLVRAARLDPDAGLLHAFGAIPPGTRAPLRLGALLGTGLPKGPVVTRTLEGTRKVDLYGTGAGQRRPLVVAIHGGSWNSGDRTQLSGAYHWLAAHGYAVAAIEYRLAPTHVYPAALEDVRVALDWLRSRADELGIDPEAIVLYGRSAGAHLALLAGYRELADRGKHGIRGVVALYPPTDMNWSWDHPTPKRVIDTPGTLSSFLGAPRDAIPEVYTDASPMTWVTEDSPPTLLVHGGRDELVYTEQSSRLAHLLDENGVRNVYLDMPWATHGCEANLAGPSGQIFLYVLERFLNGIELRGHR